MEAARKALALETLAEFARKRETESLLATANAGVLADALRIPEGLATAVAKSKRLGGRIGAVVRNSLGIDSPEPRRPLAAFLKSPDAAHQLAQAVGLSIVLSRCKAALFKPEMDALRLLYGARVVDFAFLHQSEYAASKGSATARAMSLHDADLVRRTGEATVLNWAQERFGTDVRWLQVIFPNRPETPPLPGPADATDILIEEWWKA